MSPRSIEDRQLALDCLDRALKTQCANSAEIVRVAGEFFSFVTNEPPADAAEWRKTVLEAIGHLFNVATDKADVRKLIGEHVRSFATKGLGA